MCLPTCPQLPIEICNNHIDDNQNDNIDCYDEECFLDEHCSTVLVDFNETNYFGLDNWTTLLKDDYTNFNPSGSGGMTVTIGSSGNYNFQGVSGEFRNFTLNEKIFIYWYNNGDSAISFTPLISFNDSDRKTEGVDGSWHPLTYSRIEPGEIKITEFENIEGKYNLVNINVNYDNTNELICDKILIYSISETHEGDLNQDGVINKTELDNHLLKWKNNLITITSLIDTIRFWKG